MGEGLLSN